MSNSITVEVIGVHPQDMIKQAIEHAVVFFDKKVSDNSPVLSMPWYPYMVSEFNATPEVISGEGNVIRWKADVTISLVELS